MDNNEIRFTLSDKQRELLEMHFGPEYGLMLSDRVLHLLTDILVQKSKQVTYPSDPRVFDFEKSRDGTSPMVNPWDWTITCNQEIPMTSIC